jgi:EmrB/QacA subfamily drug resistance transporter
MTPPASNPPASTPSTHPGRVLPLAVLAGSQLLIVLDATIVNVALSAIRADLSLTDAELQWVVTGYLLAFGGFLLLGGRLADRFGARRLFVGSSILFGTASLLAGFAGSAAVLFASRAVQGLAAAALAPAALSLLMAVFPAGRDRDRALGVWGGVSASGTATGLIAGGVLTQALSWQWVFWVNVPIVALSVPVALAVLPESRTEQPERFDVAGALLATTGLLCLVYGLVRAADPDATSPPAPPVLVTAAVLLLGFARLQAVRPHALVPTRLLRRRGVSGGNLVGLALGAAIYALFYVLSIFLGRTLGYGAVTIGLAFLPMAGAIAVASALAGTLLARSGVRVLLVTSVLLIAVALANLTRIRPDSDYLTTLLPSLVLAGCGLGLAFVGLTTAAVGAAPRRDSGVAAALFTTGQQIGGALGLAVLTVVSTTRTRGLTAPGSTVPDAEAITRGWSLGFGVSTGIMLAALPIVLAMIGPADRTRRNRRPRWTRQDRPMPVARDEVT